MVLWRNQERSFLLPIFLLQVTTLTLISILSESITSSQHPTLYIVETVWITYFDKPSFKVGGKTQLHHWCAPTYNEGAGETVVYFSPNNITALKTAKNMHYYRLVQHGMLSYFMSCELMSTLGITSNLFCPLCEYLWLKVFQYSVWEMGLSMMTETVERWCK